MAIDLERKKEEERFELVVDFFLVWAFTMKNLGSLGRFI